MLTGTDSPLQTGRSDTQEPISPIHVPPQSQAQSRTSIERKSPAFAFPSTSPSSSSSPSSSTPAPSSAPRTSVTNSTSSSSISTSTPKPPPPRHPPPSSAVSRLQQHLHSSINEFDAKVIFSEYDEKSQNTWSPLQVRRFLGDLQQAASYPRILPDTYIEKALSELQLASDPAGIVTWIDWKNYCYLSEEPLYHLHRKLTDHAHAITYSMIPRCVIVDEFPPVLSENDILTSFACIHPQYVYFGHIDDAPIRSILLLLSSPEDVTTALDITSITHKDMVLPVHIRPVKEHSEWPIWKITAPSNTTSTTSASSATTHLVAEGLALPIVGMYKAMDEVKEVTRELDEKLAISRSIAESKHAIATQLTAVNQQLGISQAMEATSATLSSGMNVMSETLHLAEAQQSLREAANDVTEQVTAAANLVGAAVLSNPTIAEGYGWLKGWTSMVTQTLSQVTSDTMAIVKESTTTPTASTPTSTFTSAPTAT